MTDQAAGAPEKVKSVQEIWEGDMLGRKEHAKDIQSYIESIWDRDNGREDQRSYTLAIDAGYGIGKTFFLKRLAETLKLNHPVAYVDAWRDDLADEPLVALAATLEDALEPFIDGNTNVKEKFDEFKRKAGQVAAIVGKGVAKRVIGLAIGMGAVEAAEAVITDSSADEKNDIRGAFSDISDELQAVGNPVKAGFMMSKRIEEFKEGRDAIDTLRASLEGIVDILKGNAFPDRHPPIIIIIDELDRCRPTYSVKLLEEVKHLFDVPGLVFIFGLHGEQLSKSIGAAYGPSFDGKSYLSRFINRNYTLPEPDLLVLCQFLIDRFDLNSEDLHYPAIVNCRVGEEELATLAEVLSAHASGYNLSLRDLYGVVDMLKMCCRMSKGTPLFLPLLLNEVMKEYVSRYEDQSNLHPVKDVFPISYADYVNSGNGENSEIIGINSVSHMLSVAEDRLKDMSSLFNVPAVIGKNSYKGVFERVILKLEEKGEVFSSDKSNMKHPLGYKALVKKVGRFKDPAIVPDGAMTAVVEVSSLGVLVVGK